MIINYEELKRYSEKPAFFISLFEDGGWVPATNISVEEDTLVGTDYMNNIPFKIPFKKIGGYLYLDSENPETTKQYNYVKKQFNLLINMLKAENISPINPYFYCNLPNEQKILCAALDKSWKDITLAELKEYWKIKIEQACIKFEEYIDKELVETKDNQIFVDELISIKNLIKDIKKFEEIEKTETIEEFCEFWPTLLMPAPSFVTIPV